MGTHASGTLPWSVLAISLTILAGCSRDSNLDAPRIENAAPLAPRESSFEYYGWFAVDYLEPTPALRRMRAYTNTAFAWIPLQAKVLKELGFKHIIYVFNPEEIVNQLALDEKGNIPEIMIEYAGQKHKSGVKDYAGGIPDYREKFFALYRMKLGELKRSLEETGSLSAVDLFYLADEPALHRNIYPDQEFLNQIVAEFKQVLPDKKALMVFAQNPDPLGNPFPGTGRHLSPPPLLDMVVVDPYIDPAKVSCDTESIRKWIYEDAQFSTINWAKHFGKPIIVAGDAQLRKGESIDHCYPKAIFEVVEKDDAVHGLIWFAYDKSYKDGELSGAANDPALVHMIEGLGKK